MSEDTKRVYDPESGTHIWVPEDYELLYDKASGERHWVPPGTESRYNLETGKRHLMFRGAVISDLGDNGRQLDSQTRGVERDNNNDNCDLTMKTVYDDETGQDIVVPVDARRVYDPSDNTHRWVHPNAEVVFDDKIGKRTLMFQGVPVRSLAQNGRLGFIQMKPETVDRRPEPPLEQSGTSDSLEMKLETRGPEPEPLPREGTSGDIFMSQSGIAAAEKVVVENVVKTVDPNAEQDAAGRAALDAWFEHNSFSDILTTPPKEKIVTEQDAADRAALDAWVAEDPHGEFDPFSGGNKK